VLNEESGTGANLYFAPYRYYNPQLARWMSRDPLGMVDGPNVYAYVRGNAVNNVDPLGLIVPVVVIALMVAAVVGAWGWICAKKAMAFAEQALGNDAKMHCLAGCYFQRCRALAPTALVEGLVGAVVTELYPPYHGWRDAIDDIIKTLKGQLRAYNLTKPCKDQCDDC
jgi:RHS repeat-associated protein